MTSDAAATAALVEWFRRSARDLPWRSEERDPYHVLVSELMLQQTQVDRVVPKFLAFLERFPTVGALADAEEAAVLEAWSGLGYYRRARMLHRAARVVALELGGQIPAQVDELRALPGVGAYTAAAVASLAFGVAEPVLDGNVIRVASRALAYAGDPRKKAGARELRRWVTAALLEHHDRPGEVNEALMELGATVCLVSDPLCLLCPLASICRARAEGCQADLPRPARAGREVEAQTWVALCLIDGSGRWLLEEITSGPILQGLWLPPLDRSGADGDPLGLARGLVPGLGELTGQVLPAVSHSITYRRLEVIPVVAHSGGLALPEGAGRAWERPEAPGRPTSSLLMKLAAGVAEEKSHG